MKHNTIIGWIPPWGRCEKTGKRSFPCRHAARKEARYRSQHVYRCRLCGNYHLTSRSPRVQRAIALVLSIGGHS